MSERQQEQLDIINRLASKRIAGKITAETFSLSVLITLEPYKAPEQLGCFNPSTWANAQDALNLAAIKDGR